MPPQPVACNRINDTSTRWLPGLRVAALRNPEGRQLRDRERNAPALAPPPGVQSLFCLSPGVSAALRPPATVCQASGLILEIGHLLSGAAPPFVGNFVGNFVELGQSGKQRNAHSSGRGFRPARKPPMGEISRAESSPRWTVHSSTKFPTKGGRAPYRSPNVRSPGPGFAGRVRPPA